MNAPITPPAPPYHHTPLFPLGEDRTPYRKLASRRACASRKSSAATCWSSRARRCGRWRRRPSSTSTTCCGPAIWRSSKRSSTTRRRPTTTSSSPTTFSRTPTSRRAACCRCARTPAPPSSWARRAGCVFTDGDDEAALARGRARRLPQAQPALFAARAAVDVRGEEHQVEHAGADRDLCRGRGRDEDAYKFLFIAKGGGSANKSFLFQATPSILTHDRMMAFLKEKILTLGTAACPPYHLAIVIGGTSAELTMKTVKLASARYLRRPADAGLARTATPSAISRWSSEVHKLTQSLGVGAQFGGKYFCHDVRVIRLPRHGASLPIGLGVSCSADRQALGKITRTACSWRSSSTIRRNICRRSTRRRSAATWWRSICASR